MSIAFLIIIYIDLFNIVNIFQGEEVSKRKVDSFHNGKTHVPLSKATTTHEVGSTRYVKYHLELIFII
jgi:hypothetical protein